MTAGATTSTTASEAPLAGRFIVVTRTLEQSRGLARPLEALGAQVIACPVIALVDPPEPALVGEAIQRLSTYDWVVLTSANAVDRFFADARFAGDPVSALGHVKVAAVGDATASRMARWDVTPHLIPDDFRAEGLVQALVARGVGRGQRVLLPRALEAREVLRDALEPMGVTVDVVPVYQTVAAAPNPVVIERLGAGSVDAVTFTSPSTVRHFVAMLGGAGLDAEKLMERVVRASIGPVTTAALLEVGSSATIEAKPSTVPALVEAITRALSGGGQQ